ncbi:MAG: hypothetical protein BWZ02_00787 [Lentisphaerae bacterium ADurb.BinA184]|nr:MAG: hypothetical protein BWZ02_00787 [Lentisphaerae bacterium ADurb.BinA184]
MTYLRQPLHATPTAPGGRPRPTRKPFTLVEVLVAMAVLAVMMLMLFRLFAAAQNVWSLSAASMRIYENARVATELMERDLQCVLIVDSIYNPDDVPFYIRSQDKITFVSPVRDDDASDSRLDTGGWTCGKDGQGVPVSQGLPTVLVSKMTVGGENA